MKLTATLALSLSLFNFGAQETLMKCEHNIQRSSHSMTTVCRSVQSSAVPITSDAVRSARYRPGPTLSHPKFRIKPSRTSDHPHHATAPRDGRTQRSHSPPSRHASCASAVEILQSTWLFEAQPRDRTKVSTELLISEQFAAGVPSFVIKYMQVPP